MSEPTPRTETLTHGRNCTAWTDQHGYQINEEDCTCGLKWRIQTQTAETLLVAWQKRCTEAEQELKKVLEPGRECLHCGGIHPITAMYRCFDCNAWLCEDCTRGHMAAGREPHPKLRDQFIVELAELKQQRDSLERTLAAQRTALLSLAERIRREGMQGVANEIEEIVGK